MCAILKPCDCQLAWIWYMYFIAQKLRSPSSVRCLLIKLSLIFSVRNSSENHEGWYDYKNILPRILHLHSRFIATMNNDATIPSSWYRAPKSNSLLSLQRVTKLVQFSTVARWTSAPFVSCRLGETRNKSGWTSTVNCWADSACGTLFRNKDWSFGSRADFTSSIARIKFFKHDSEEKTTWKSGDCS